MTLRWRAPYAKLKRKWQQVRGYMLVQRQPDKTKKSIGYYKSGSLMEAEKAYDITKQEVFAILASYSSSNTASN